MQASADKQAAQQALTGYNYLTSGPGAAAESGYINRGNSAGNAQADLLGLNGAAGSDAASPAYQNYLNSTGYKFQLKSGQDAIGGSAASRGILNSGSTAKALTQYGQNLASTGFDNYLGHLSGVSQQGQVGLGQVAQAGTSGGATAAEATSAAGKAQSQGLNNALGAFLGGI
jgi:hypothetical protein